MPLKLKDLPDGKVVIQTSDGKTISRPLSREAGEARIKALAEERARIDARRDRESSQRPASNEG